MTGPETSWPGAGAGRQPAQLPVPALALGEGPCWDAGAGALYWIDAPPGRVHRLDVCGLHACWEVGQPIGAVFPRAGGGLLVAARDGFIALDPVTGAVAMLAPLETDRPGNQLNDGACDRSGRLFAGTMATDERPGAGALYRLDADLTVTQLVTGVGISNGIGWSPDNRLMYYSDSLAYQVDVFDYDPATGEITGRRAFTPVGGGEVMPDGLAVDVEGFVWVAHWGGSRLARYDPDGKLDQTVEFPHANVTSCAFGGPLLDRLYVTTAAGPANPAGGLFVLSPGVSGLPCHPFGG
ncbi:MAG: SMP-30/gluconolactonase/LRE family protein [Streptosporangiaceae bacterium]